MTRLTSRRPGQPARQHRGKFCYYPLKEQRPVTINVPVDTREALERIEGEIDGLSRSDVMTHAARKLLGLPINRDLDRKIKDVLQDAR